MMDLMMTHNIHLLSLTFINKEIKNVNEETKYLGVILDSSLAFTNHFKKMCHVLEYIANFCHLRNSMSVEAAKTYLNAMILLYVQHYISCRSQASELLSTQLDHFMVKH